MNFFKKIIFSIILAPFICFAMTSQEIKNIMKKCVDEGHSQGMVIAVIDENGTQFYKYGQMAVDDPTPIDENAVFETGSITKIFTSLLLTEMVKNGDVKLDDPIEMYLPKHLKLPEYNGKKITLGHLASHRAGFDYMPENFIMSDMYNPFSEYSVEYVYDYLSNLKLDYEPGSQYRYSNIGISLLCHIISLITNQEFEDLATERLFKPMGMESSKVHLTDEMKNRFAAAHIRDRKVPHWGCKEFEGAGALRSSAKDLARFIEANLGFYKTDVYPVLQDALKSRHPQEIPYLDVGHEWNISYQYKPEIVFHGGATGGHQVFIGFCPETKKGVVVCSNSCAWIYDIGKNILNKKWYLKEFRQQAIIVPMMLYKFIGDYTNIQDGSKCKILMKSQGHMSMLMLKWSYYPQIPLYPSTEKDFFMKVKPAQINFDLNKENDNIIDLMTINYNGKIYKFRKNYN
ncbi:MAG: D-alanyl-D-alanine-carboxypeptidase/endopeptidase AmpH [Candidatus Anoxychlamydiales bacterium]|nr:D-alanyl-D-alanine-carboxypeptidase/endopeptidase AmpH [Candidatus Anoxychlamydiales bacterium]